MTLEPGVLDAVRHRVVAEGVSDTVVRAALRDARVVLGEAEVLALTRRVRHDLAGLGPLELLLADAEVTDVVVNGADAVFVDRGGGLEAASVSFPDDDAVRRLAQRLAASAGRPLDDTHPHADIPLAAGRRLHAVLPPVVERPCLSLRVPRRRPFSLATLADAGSLPAPLPHLLGSLVAARRSFLVTGGTGSGKTALLTALLGEVPAAERLVLVEDTAELVPDHPHVVRLVTRPPTAEGTGEVTLRSLVRQALRMRPDRLVVGEVRGAEVSDLLAALNTGHEGGCGTVHANRAHDLPARIEALASMAGLPREAAASQLVSAVEVVVHVVRRRDGSRGVAEVAVLTRSAAGEVVTRPAWSVAGGCAVRGPAAAELDALVSGTVP